MLLLGGSSLGVPTIAANDISEMHHQQQQQQQPPTWNPAQGLHNLGPQILWGVSSLEGYHSRCTAALLDAASGLSKLRVLELTFFVGKVVAAVAEQLQGVQVTPCLSSR